jgi:MMP 1-O-methyltransferase
MILETSRVAAETIAGAVEGWLTVPEGRVLHDLASRTDPSTAIVEVGSWKGKSTIWLAKGSLAGRGARVYAVDHHRGSPDPEERARQQPGAQDIWSFDEFRSNMGRAGVTEIVEPVVASSAEAARSFPRQIGLLFIDGDHSYEGVKNDLESWFPKLIDGAVVAFHDTNVTIYPGVKRLVREAVFLSRCFVDIRYVDSLLFATKVLDSGSLDRLRNRTALLLRYPDDYVGRLRWNLLPHGIRRLARRTLNSFAGTRTGQ